MQNCSRVTVDFVPKHTFALHQLMLAMLLLSAPSSALSDQSTAKWVTDEETAFDWKGDKTLYRFQVQHLEVSEKEADKLEPEDFTRVLIKAPNGESIYVKQLGGIVEIDGSYKDAEQLKDSEISSRYLYVRSMQSDGKGPKILVAFGATFSSSPGAVTILALNEKGIPTKVFYPDSIDIDKFVDVNGDGAFEIIGRHGSESMEECKQSYNPYEVYTISLTLPRLAQYSQALSKKYNLDYYYGWVDPDDKGSYFVVTCPDDKVGIFKYDIK